MENVTHSSNVDHDVVVTHPARKKHGGWKAIKYILGNEAFEKMASMSLQTNMTLYLKTKYNLDGIILVNVVNIWNGSTNLATLGGAIVSDGYLGRSRTILIGSLCSFLGIGLMTITAGIPQLRPSACNGQIYCPQPHSWQLCVLFVSLSLVAIGAGGIRPCNIAFGADQFDTTTEKGRKQLESFCNWWYLSFTVALFISLITVLYIQTNVSWVIGYAIPTACLAFSIAIFLIGYRTFVIKKPQGNIFVDIAKVVVAYYRKRNFKFEAIGEASFYDLPRISGADKHVTVLAHTNRFRSLDRVALITNPGDLDDQGMSKTGWRFCSLQQVEKLKCMLGILPIWLSGILCFVAMDQQGSYGILQAVQMDKSIGKHFKIPPAWMNLTAMIALSIWISIYEGIYVPQTKKKTGKEKRLTVRQRIRTGIVMSILCMLVAGLVERMRRNSAIKHGLHVSPMSVGWLLPQFIFSGLTEAFGAIAIMEFFTQQMPECMRAIAGAIFFLSLSIASYTSSLISTIIHNVTAKNGKLPWVGANDLNKGRLEYYYYIIAALGALNFVYFTFFASNYVSSGKNGKGIREIHLQNVDTGIGEQAGHELHDEDDEEKETRDVEDVIR